MQRSLVLSLLLACGGLLLLAGCGGTSPQIETYTISRDAPDRMLGGILLEESRGLFFKLTGPRKELDAAADDFRAFLKSVKFDAATGRPSWELPEGWKEDSTPRQMRLTTLLVPLGKGDDGNEDFAELSITVLPRSGGGDVPYLLDNINRWRNEMGQGRVTAQDLDSIEQIEAPAGQILVVSIAGRQKAAMPGTPPIMGKSG
jgi:hypothetical protein